MPAFAIKYFKVVAFFSIIQSFTTFIEAADKNINPWVNYNLGSPDQDLIQILSNQIQSTGVFYLESFLTEPFLKILQSEVLEATTVRYDSKRTIVQDQGDFLNYANDSIRNHLFNNSMQFIPRSNFLQNSEIHDFYEYGPLLNFLKLVTGIDGLFLSGDYDGSVVGARGRNTDGYTFGWHFDEHPLGCVLLLNQSAEGGTMEYIDYRSGEHSEIRPWGKIQSFFDGDEKEVGRLKEVAAKPSDLYCFLGNTTLHRVTEVGKRMPDYRATIVFSFAMEQGFKHSDSFRETGYWANNVKMSSKQNAEL